MTAPTIYQRAGLALDLLELRDQKWIDHAWFIYHHWPNGLDPELRDFLRDALGKLQLCHTGDVVDPAIDRCRSVMRKVVDSGAE